MLFWIGSKIDASKMILDDLYVMLYDCDYASCFMIIAIYINVRYTEE